MKLLHALVLFLKYLCRNKEKGLIVVYALSFTPLYAQTIIKGSVSSAESGEPLPFVSIIIQGTGEGTHTGTDGKYELQTILKNGKVEVSVVGYFAQTISFSGSQMLNITLKKNATTLHEVIVKPSKEKYRNKENPAVALIRKVIQHKEENRLGVYDYVSYREYEKLEIGFLSNRDAELNMNKGPFKKFQFAFENTDTEKFRGKALLPLYLEENIKQQYLRSHPKASQTIWTANKKVTFDKRFINNRSAGTAMKYLYQDVDIYQNNIYLLTNSFLSPINKLSPTFYKFYITDTLDTPNGKLVELTFIPRNKNDVLLNGRLYITLDGHYSVKSADLGVGKSANLNWVTDFRISLNYEKGPDGKYHKAQSDLSIIFGTDNAKKNIFGERTLLFQDYDTQTPIPDSIFKKREPLLEDSSRLKDKSFWLANRPVALTQAEANTYKNYDSLNSMKSFRRIIDWGSFLATGYKVLGPIEIGPTGSFFSFNPVEGYKQRLGFRTDEAFSKRFYAATYAAYGFKDKRWKYYMSWAYSFNKKSIHDFPFHYLQASFQRDTRIPGQQSQFEEESNILLSIKRGVNDKYLYSDLYNLAYVYEFGDHFRLEAQYQRWTQEAAGGFRFTTSDNGIQDTVPSITTADLGLMLRWAPHEQFFDQKEGRSGIPNKYPILSAHFNFGVKDLTGGQYDYQRFELNVKKRFYFSQLGFADVTFDGGYLKGKVPYPLLFIPHANQTYSFQLRSYNLMNFMEFVSDQYVSLKVDYHLHGFFFNKIPLLRVLHLREVAGFNVLYGTLRAENDPGKDPSLFQFPVNGKGIPTTYSLAPRPYVEFNVGIENIFRALRVDYVRRLSYLNHPNVSPWGIRVSLNFAL